MASKMFVDPLTGNVGIGTTSPQKQLHVIGDARIEGNLIVNGTQTIIDTDVQTTERLDITNNGTGPALRVNQTGGNDVIDIQDSGVSVLKILDGGNVGIGTDNPQAKLHVNGFVKNSIIAFFANTVNTAAGSYTAEVTGYTNILVNLGNCYNGTTCRFTPTVAGYYSISASAELPSNGGTRGIILRKNATTNANGTLLSGNFSTCASGASTSQIIPLDAIVQMNGSTDYVSVWGHASGPTFATQATPCYFSGSLIALS